MLYFLRRLGGLLLLCTLAVYGKSSPSYHTQVVRDKWGVPHIYGHTDADVAYGLAWCTAEDDFKSMQETLYAGLGVLGRVKGKEGAARDFLAQLIDVKKAGEASWEAASPAFKSYISGFVQGINDYAAAHPREVQLKHIFPINEAQAIAGSVFIFAITSAIHESVSSLMSNALTKEDKSTAYLFDAFSESHFGSNAWAISSALSENGSTMLVINPHQPMEGPFSWYEASLQSDEGLHIHGATFPGGSSIFVGNTPDLGWAHTYNGVDLIDEFKLETRGDKKPFYLWGGRWLPLEERPIKLKVKLGGIILPVTKMTWMSKYGPVLKNKSGYYALRYPTMFKNRGLEQYYQMNKAENFEEFKTALAMQQFPRYNVIYADREDNIYYLFNALIPVRKPGYDWSYPVAANDTTLAWNSFYTLDELPQVTNPDCRYVYNMNNEPFRSTCDVQCPNPNMFPKQMGILRTETNRSAKFEELICHDQRFCMDDLRAIKFDYSLPSQSRYLQSVAALFTLDEKKYPDLSQEIQLLRQWDRNSLHDSRGAAVFYLTCNDLFLRHKWGASQLNNGFSVSESEFVISLHNARKYIARHFKKQWVSLGDIVRLYRGKISVPVSGLPDVMSPNYPVPYKKGRMTPFVGDSYTQLVAFNKDGSTHIETLLPYGSCAKKGHPHSTDQMKLYSEGHTKYETLDKEELRQNAERIYEPGRAVWP